ncbi:hypothetical protein DITRI_Ditri17bG0087600 [Diplodiscus trichospermus]
MPGILNISSIVLPHWCTTSRHIVRMAASQTTNAGVSLEAVAIKPPSHPTYDLNGVIKLALAEDAGNRGDVTCMATIPFDMKEEAHFLAKEDGIIAGIALAEMVFQEVDPSLKVEWSRKDGDYVQKGLQFGKVYGIALSIVVAERIALNFMQRMSGIATLTKASGNVTLETVHKIGQTGVTYISSGALTHSVKALDISLKIDTELALEVGRRTKRA